MFSMLLKDFAGVVDNGLGYLQSDMASHQEVQAHTDGARSGHGDAAGFCPVQCLHCYLAGLTAAVAIVRGQRYQGARLYESVVGSHEGYPSVNHMFDYVSRGWSGEDPSVGDGPERIHFLLVQPGERIAPSYDEGVLTTE